METFHSGKWIYDNIGEFSIRMRTFSAEAQAFNELHKQFSGVRVIAYSPNDINIQEIIEINHDHKQQDWRTRHYTVAGVLKAHAKKIIDGFIDKRYKLQLEAVYFDDQAPTWC